MLKTSIFSPHLKKMPPTDIKEATPVISRRSLSKDAPGTAFRSLLEKQSSGFHGPTLGFVLPIV
jgi:hypothetical protein